MSGESQKATTNFFLKNFNNICKGIPSQVLPAPVKKIVSHASGAVISNIKENGIVEFAVIEYNKNGKTSFRNVMETGEIGERTLFTLNRGLKQEIAKETESFIATVFDEPVLISLKKDDNGDPDNFHLQIFYTCLIPKTGLRQVKMIDGDEVLGPVRWIEGEELVTTMKLKNTPSSHIDAVLSRIFEIALDNKKVAIRYMDLLSDFKPHSFTNEEEEIIREYLSDH